LFSADLPGADGRNKEVLASCWRTGQTALHGELAYVRKRIRDRPLKQRFGGRVKGSIRGEVGIEVLEGSEETGLLFRPGQRSGIVPALASLHCTESPVEEVAHVREDFDRLPAAPVECSEGVRRVIQSASGTIGKAGNGMAKEFAFLVHAANITQAHMTAEQLRC